MAYSNSRILDIAEILKQCRWFSALPESLQNDFLKYGTIVELEQNQRLFSAGDTKSCLYCVIGGAVGISSYLECGKDVLVTIMEPVSWGGELAFFDRVPRTHTVFAIKPSYVLLIQQDYLNQVLESDPLLWRHLGLLLTQKLRATLEISKAMTSLPGSARLAHRLLWIAKNNGTWIDKHKRLIDIQQEDLARMTFLSRTTANQILKQFERCGAVQIHYGKIEIINASILKDIANGRSSQE